MPAAAAAFPRIGARQVLPWPVEFLPFFLPASQFRGWGYRDGTPLGVM